nr:uncharacterized protein LOC111415480 isoform X2 [Onthophagus taurus]
MCCDFDMVKKTFRRSLIISLLNILSMVILACVIGGMFYNSNNDVINKATLLIYYLFYNACIVMFLTGLGWRGLEQERNLVLNHAISTVVVIVCQVIGGVTLFLRTENDDSVIIINDENRKVIAIAFISVLGVEMVALCVTALFSLLLSCMIYNNRNTNITEHTRLLAQDA